MPTGLNKKNRIILSDYDYRREIEARLLFSSFSSFEIELLKEIIDNSLKFSINELMDILEASEADVLAGLKALSTTKLFELQGRTLIVNKDVRKYLEWHIQKFDTNFRPGMEFVQSLLAQVPQIPLCNWYGLPKCFDDIFTTILDKYLLTPKRYQRYLNEICYENDHPMMVDVIHLLFSSPELELDAALLKTKYEMTDEQFHEFALHLEFNFICCLGYKEIEGKWIEYLVPFSEWKKYLEFKKETLPKPLTDSLNISRKHKEDFGYILDLEAAIRTPTKKDNCFDLIEKALNLKFLKKHDQTLCITPKGEEWLLKTLPEKAMDLYFYTLSCHRYYSGTDEQVERSDREIREVEKSLKSVIHYGWVYLDDFVKGVTAAIGNCKPVTLTSKGKRWSYATPTYSKEELLFIKKTICGHLFECGMIAAGSDNNKDVFCVTPFGKTFLGD